MKMSPPRWPAVLVRIVTGGGAVGLVVAAAWPAVDSAAGAAAASAATADHHRTRRRRADERSTGCIERSFVRGTKGTGPVRDGYPVCAQYCHCGSPGACSAPLRGGGCRSSL